MIGARKQRGQWRRALGRAALVLAVVALIATNAPALHLLGSEPIQMIPARQPRLPLAAVFLSGDMGFHFGMSSDVAQALAARGVPVVGVVSPVAFAHHRTPDEARAIVEQAMRTAMRSTGARQLLLVGQSYGADIVATVAPQLPPDLLAHVRAINLMVPGRYVYFRADPTTLAYFAKPDAQPARAFRAFHGPPVICIYGMQEDDSLCPELDRSAVKVIALPGDHHLDRKPERLVAAAMGALHALVPAIRP